MVQIKITQGLDIPIKGKPMGGVHALSANGHVVKPHLVGINLSTFDDVKFKLLVNVGDVVKIGQPLLEDKSLPGVFFTSPAAGTVKEITRGLKRSLQSISIELASNEEFVTFPTLDPTAASSEQIKLRLMEAGLFPSIRRRPFNILANPQHKPRSIFVKAVESAPFVPSAEMQVAGYEKEFQAGLNALTKLTEGPVHLVYRKGTTFAPFSDAKNVQKHTVEGPHPVANSSLHIQHIDPIRSPEDIVWTISAFDVAAIGYLLLSGKILIDRVVSVAGPGVLPERCGFYRARAGIQIEDLIAGRVPRGVMRFISGDVLTGFKAHATDFLGFYHHTFCVVPENTEREFLHFLRMGVDKYSATGAYLSGHLNNKNREYDFTTSLHGEERAFVTSEPYRQVMPLRIPTMELVKAVMAQDFDLAEVLGLLEVDGEDFALPTFIDPSKIEMVSIINHGLRQHAKEVLQ